MKINSWSIQMTTFWKNNDNKSLHFKELYDQADYIFLFNLIN